MEANELRIGNYIGSIGNIYEVILVDSKGNVKGFDGGTSFNLDDSITPIPLTEEWLLKFGYVLYGKEATDSESPRDWYWIKKGFAISIDNITWKTSYIELILLSVHQLQNLYYALTGEELTIKSE